jgi:hypothetical protein
MSGRRALRLLRRLGSAASLLAAALPALAAKPSQGITTELEQESPSKQEQFRKHRSSVDTLLVKGSTPKLRSSPVGLLNAPMQSPAAI